MKRLNCTLLLTGLFWTSATFAQPFQTVQQLEAFVHQQASTPGVVGLAMAVVAGGKPVWSAGHGFADREAQRPVTPHTPFMLGSVSKVVTGVALMQLVEQGKLPLDQDVRPLLPFGVHPSRPITLRHLATHSAGILDRTDLLEAHYTPGDSPVTLQAFLQHHFDPSIPAEQLFLPDAPGTRYHYSNVGIALAGLLVEKATGLSLDRYSEQHIFEPLGMQHTHWFLRDFQDPAEIARPHEEGQPLPHYGYPTWPDGQLRSSAHDLARFLAAVVGRGSLEGTQLLQPQTVEHMLQEQALANPGKHGQALFWEINRGLYGHNGGDPGVFTLMYFDPATQVGVVLLMNQQDEVHVQVGLQILTRLLRQGGVVGPCPLWCS